MERDKPHESRPRGSSRETARYMDCMEMDWGTGSASCACIGRVIDADDLWAVGTVDKKGADIL
jgi:hypothetical protein